MQDLQPIVNKLRLLGLGWLTLCNEPRDKGPHRLERPDDRGCPPFRARVMLPGRGLPEYPGAHGQLWRDGRSWTVPKEKQA